MVTACYRLPWDLAGSRKLARALRTAPCHGASAFEASSKFTLSRSRGSWQLLCKQEDGMRVTKILDSPRRNSWAAGNWSGSRGLLVLVRNITFHLTCILR
jgi:hypothetical protein